MARLVGVGVFAVLAAVAVLAGTGAGFSAPAPADLQVTVLPSRPDVYVHRRLVYTVVVKNVGGSDASNVGVNLGFSSDVEVDGASSSRALCIPSDPVDCTVGALERNRSAKIRIALRPDASGPLVATASAGLDDPALEPDQADNDASASTYVHPGRIGAPKLEVRHKPTGGVASLVATVTGELKVSEPGTLTWRLKNTKTGAALSMQGGSAIGGHTFPSASTVFTRGVGAEGVVSFTLRFAVAANEADRAYAVVVRATDLEGQTADISAPVRLTG